MRKFGDRQTFRFKLNSVGLVLLGLVLAGAGVSVAQEVSDSFLSVEYSVLGASSSASWRSLVPGGFLASGQVGGDENPAEDEFNEFSQPDDDAEDGAESAGHSNMGRKVKTGLLSALMPGAGQYYNGHKKKAYIMAGVEVGIWTAYFIFDKQGDNRLNSAREYAAVFAGTSGEHNDSYWQNVGRYMDSDLYNESRLREARALGEPISGLVYGDDTWQWVNEDRKQGYQLQRADGNIAYDHRDFMILFSVINRAFSVVDGVLGVKSHPTGVEAEVLGMNVSLDMLPSWHDPGAQLAVARSF